VACLARTARRPNCDSARLRDLVVLGGDATAVLVLPGGGASDEGHSALSLAATSGHTDALDVLLQALTVEAFVAADASAAGGPKAWLAAQLNRRLRGVVAGAGGAVLHLAAARGHVAVCRRLLGAGSDPWQLDDAHLTPLHRAAMHGRSDCVRALAFHSLCEAGVEGAAAEAAAMERLVQSTGPSGLSPLHCAVLAGHRETVEALLDVLCGRVTKPADVQAATANGATAANQKVAAAAQQQQQQNGSPLSEKNLVKQRLNQKMGGGLSGRTDSSGQLGRSSLWGKLRSLTRTSSGGSLGSVSSTASGGSGGSSGGGRAAGPQVVDGAVSNSALDYLDHASGPLWPGLIDLPVRTPGDGECVTERGTTTTAARLAGAIL
jgi:ankyrin repeat protein